MSRRRNGGPASGPNGGSADARRLLRLLNALGSTTFRQLLWPKAANELDLTLAQSQVLFHVAQHPGCHMGALARAFRVTLPAVTHIIDRLEQKGLVRRAPDPADRRVAVLALTPPGQALIRELEDLQLDALDGVLARLSSADRRQVLVGLTALVSVGDAVG